MKKAETLNENLYAFVNRNLNKSSKSKWSELPTVGRSWHATHYGKKKSDRL